MRVICINSTPVFPDIQLIEGKAYYVEDTIQVFNSIRYILRDHPGSYPIGRFIPAEVEFEIEKQIFDALQK